MHLTQIAMVCHVFVCVCGGGGGGGARICVYVWNKFHHDFLAPNCLLATNYNLQFPKTLFFFSTGRCSLVCFCFLIFGENYPIVVHVQGQKVVHA